MELDASFLALLFHAFSHIFVSSIQYASTTHDKINLHEGVFISLPSRIPSVSAQSSHCSVTQFLIGLFMTTSIDWHKYVQLSGMRCNSIPSDWIFVTIGPIIWTQNESNMRRGTVCGGSVSFHGDRHCLIHKSIMDSSIHSFFGWHTDT